MGDYVTLIGAEEVGRAGQNMRQAADEMQRAANQINDTVERFIRALDEHAARIEAAATGSAA
jgi:uncharacterized protein YukE